MYSFKIVLINKYGQTYFGVNKQNEIFWPKMGVVSLKSDMDIPVLDFKDKDESIVECRRLVEKYKVFSGLVIDLNAKSVIHTYELEKN